jgi:glycosyltransferase involved in cell wall biosynthesis
LFVAHGCYLDNANGAAIASRALMETLGRKGFIVEALSGSMLDLDQEVEPLEWLAGLGVAFEKCRDGAATHLPAHCRGSVGGVPVTLYLGPTTRLHDAGDPEREEFLRLFDSTAARLRPQVVIAYGGNRLASEVRSRARAGGMAVVFPLHNFHYTEPDSFAHADAVLVPSNFAADYYREALALHCTILPYLIDPARVRAERQQARYVTFVNPSVEKGVYAFARIADELGRLRPDIPILVVEGRGTESTVAACGLDLRARGNVFFMAHTPDPRAFWSVSRLCLLPSLWWENQPLVAVEAMINGIPVIGSDRGGIPETLGKAGITLPLPERLTPATRMLPTAEEVRPWVETIIRLWDDPELYAEHRRRASGEAARWAPEELEPQYVRLFNDIRPRPTPPVATPVRRTKAVVLVPHLNGIEWECERGLRGLEQSGVQVVRREGSSAIDVARNTLASEALHAGAESIMFIDSDIGFNPLDALRLLARPEPVVGGVYAKKSRRAMASVFADGMPEIRFGRSAFGLYPLRYAATGFLRIRTDVLRRMIDELNLPLCNTRWGRGLWPFFQPSVVSEESGDYHYLGEDWAFSHRLGLLGITPLADTSIRLWHYGRYGYSWEDAGADVVRYQSYIYRAGGPEDQSPRGPSAS